MPIISGIFVGACFDLLKKLETQQKNFILKF